jgi:hypothetical protein
VLSDIPSPAEAFLNSCTGMNPLSAAALASCGLSLRALIKELVMTTAGAGTGTGDVTVMTGTTAEPALRPAAGIPAHCLQLLVAQLTATHFHTDVSQGKPTQTLQASCGQQLRQHQWPRQEGNTAELQQQDDNPNLNGDWDCAAAGAVHAHGVNVHAEGDHQQAVVWQQPCKEAHPHQQHCRQQQDLQQHQVSEGTAALFQQGQQYQQHPDLSVALDIDPSGVLDDFLKGRHRTTPLPRGSGLSQQPVADVHESNGVWQQQEQQQQQRRRRRQQTAAQQQDCDEGLIAGTHHNAPTIGHDFINYDESVPPAQQQLLFVPQQQQQQQQHWMVPNPLWDFDDMGFPVAEGGMEPDDLLQSPPWPKRRLVPVQHDWTSHQQGQVLKKQQRQCGVVSHWPIEQPQQQKQLYSTDDDDWGLNITTPLELSEVACELGQNPARVMGLAAADQWQQVDDEMHWQQQQQQHDVHYDRQPFLPEDDLLHPQDCWPDPMQVEVELQGTQWHQQQQLHSSSNRAARHLVVGGVPAAGHAMGTWDRQPSQIAAGPSIFHQRHAHYNTAGRPRPQQKPRDMLRSVPFESAGVAHVAASGSNNMSNSRSDGVRAATAGSSRLAAAFMPHRKPTKQLKYTMAGHRQHQIDPKHADSKGSSSKSKTRNKICQTKLCWA